MSSAAQMRLIRLFKKTDDPVEPLNSAARNRVFLPAIAGQNKFSLRDIQQFADLQGGSAQHEAKFPYKNMARFDATSRRNQKNRIREQGIVANGTSRYRVTSL